MHGDWCPSAYTSGTGRWSGAQKPVNILLAYSESYSEQRLSRMCGQRAHNLLVFRSPQFSFTFGLWSSCRHKTVLACFFRTSKGSAHHVETKVQRLPVSQQIRSPRKSDPGRIRYASDFDPTFADSIRGISGAIGFPLCQLLRVIYGVFMRTWHRFI